ncbi:valine--pyruvate transaminase [Candidatus Saccharibacteria bacterium]|nr:valine--pyruvate transaminase [Candidatus Saccharibacteria bacterium]
MIDDNRTYDFSDIGERLTKHSGILELMDDLGRAINESPPRAMLGGGNPAIIPELSELYAERLSFILRNKDTAQPVLGNYDTPAGNKQFLNEICRYFNETYSIQITNDNLATSPGSQAGFFMLFNMLAGKKGDRTKHILLPLVPEYIGYTNQGLADDMFVSYKPKIEKIGDHEFKYSIDFDALEITEDTAAICISRPTNPSGNVVSDEEIKQLQELARAHNIPLIVDNAYGLPFPGVIEKTAHLPELDGNTILSFSLSKIGLPTARVGFFIGPESLMNSIQRINAKINLSSPSVGQYLIADLLETNQLDLIRDEIIAPFYRQRADFAWNLLHKILPGEISWRVHSYNGSYFFWLWVDGIKITSIQLYERLKTRGVIVVPGEYFFAGQDVDSWRHAHQCLRINFARPEKELEVGFSVLAEELVKATA